MANSSDIRKLRIVLNRLDAQYNTRARQEFRLHIEDEVRLTGMQVTPTLRRFLNDVAITRGCRPNMDPTVANDVFEEALALVQTGPFALIPNRVFGPFPALRSGNIKV